MWLLVLKVHDTVAAQFFGGSMRELLLLPSNVYIINAAFERSTHGYLAHKR